MQMTQSLRLRFERSLLNRILNVLHQIEPIEDDSMIKQQKEKREEHIHRFTYNSHSIHETRQA